MYKICLLVFACLTTYSHFLAWAEVGCTFIHKKDSSLESTIWQVENSNPLNKKFLKMKLSQIIRITLIFIGFIFIVFPAEIQAGEIYSSTQEKEATVIVETPNQMTEKEMNDLLGEDPYLGQTSYLQSPDGFSQKDK
tara:strand:- start:16388 stop:16798 length:411 start_codon:yes stop_codon:yes gene_type:complete